MAKKLYEEQDIQNIANAIRSKNGSSDTYRASDMDQAISEIVTAAEAIDDSTISESTTWSSTKISSELEGKANIDGSYDDMTVGNAKQLVSTVNTEDKIPYNFRTSGGSADIGDRLTDKLVGGTLAFNQMIPNESKDFSNSATDTRSNLYFYFMSITSPAQVYYYKSISTPTILNILVKPSTVSDGIRIKHNGLSTDLVIYNLTTQALIANHVYYLSINIASVDPTTASGIETKDFNLIDLTQMFGSTIADYIYTLEQDTAGAGVAWFKDLFPKAYYAYNAGELMSVKTSAHNTIGFNAFNPTTNTAILLGGNQYQITGTYTSVSYQDINGDAETLTIDANGKFTPTNNGTLTVVGGNSTDTCVHLVWDGERDGEYEPYVKHEYALDSDLELRGIAKLDSNNKLYYDGDTYESNGTVTRKYGIVDLGSLNWGYNAGIFNSSVISTLKSPTNNIICLPYKTVAYNITSANMPDKSIKCYGGAENRIIYIKDSNYTDAETFKAAMDGVYLVYELATPTTESADAFQDPQIVDDFGTEEYVDTRAVAIPVGHDTLYQPNLRAKLEMAPESPSGNGDYIVRQTNGENTYVPLVIPNILPAAPTEDGTYTLNVTVSNGSATYSWVSVQ